SPALRSSPSPSFRSSPSAGFLRDWRTVPRSTVSIKSSWSGSTRRSGSSSPALFSTAASPCGSASSPSGRTTIAWSWRSRTSERRWPPALHGPVQTAPLTPPRLPSRRRGMPRLPGRFVEIELSAKICRPGPTQRNGMSTTVAEKERRDLPVEKLDEVVIRFAGDSGDGMQLTGTQFTNTSALIGNDLSTLPDFPAEIRAPAGTLPGVSAFQVRIADYDIHTPGDAPDVLIAMNPAALKKELGDLKPNGVIIVNTDEFNARNLARAGYATNPLEDQSLAKYRVFQAALNTMTRRTLEGSGLDSKSMDRCKNMFALGMCYWLFSRPLESTITFLNQQFAKKPHLAEANIKVLKAG